MIFKTEQWLCFLQGLWNGY